MATITPNTQIAAGHNNAAGLTRFDAIVDGNGVKFVMPRTVPYHEEGEMLFGPNGVAVYDGFQRQDFEFRIMTVAQYELLRATYTGFVTVKTTLNSGSSYANYNAVAWLDPKTAADYIPNAIVTMYAPGFTGPAYDNVRLHITRLEAL
jgi:hypothetical protein